MFHFFKHIYLKVICLIIQCFGNFFVLLWKSKWNLLILIFIWLEMKFSPSFYVSMKISKFIASACMLICVYFHLLLSFFLAERNSNVFQEFRWLIFYDTGDSVSMILYIQTGSCATECHIKQTKPHQINDNSLKLSKEHWQKSIKYVLFSPHWSQEPSRLSMCGDCRTSLWTERNYFFGKDYSYPVCSALIWVLI